MNTDAPLFAVPEHETLAQRCRRLAEDIADHERSITGTVINLTEVRTVLAEAAEALEQ